MDGGNGLGVIVAAVEFRHAHAAEPHGRDDEALGPEVTLLHGLPSPFAGAAWAYFRNCPTKSNTFFRSRRNTPPVPAQLPLRPNEVTPAITLLVPR